MQRSDGKKLKWPEVFRYFTKVNITLENGHNYLLSINEIAWPRQRVKAINVSSYQGKAFETYIVERAVVGKTLKILFCFDDCEMMSSHTSHETEFPIREIRLYNKINRVKKSKTK